MRLGARGKPQPRSNAEAEGLEAHCGRCAAQRCTHGGFDFSDSPQCVGLNVSPQPCGPAGWRRGAAGRLANGARPRHSLGHRTTGSGGKRLLKSCGGVGQLAGPGRHGGITLAALVDLAVLTDLLDKVVVGSIGDPAEQHGGVFYRSGGTLEQLSHTVARANLARRALGQRIGYLKADLHVSPTCQTSGQATPTHQEPSA